MRIGETPYRELGLPNTLEQGADFQLSVKSMGAFLEHSRHRLLVPCPATEWGDLESENLPIADIDFDKVTSWLPFIMPRRSAASST